MWWMLVLVTLSSSWLVLEHFSLTSQAWWSRSLFMESFLNSFLMEGERGPAGTEAKVVQKPVELEGLEELLVEKSIGFMEGAVRAGQPFLLYHAFPAVHTPLVPGNRWGGSSRHGAYGDKVWWAF